MQRDEIVEVQNVHLSILKELFAKLLDELGYEIRRDKDGKIYLGEQGMVYPAKKEYCDDD